MPAETCVARALAELDGVSDVELIRRDEWEQQVTLPRRLDKRAVEVVEFRFTGHPYSVYSSVTDGHDGQVTIYGVAGGQCPRPEHLLVYNQMIEFVEPALASACFDNAAFKRKTSRRCRAR